MITTTEKQGNKTIITVHQDIVDLKTGEQFKSALMDAFVNGDLQIVLDFHSVQLINSHGIGKMLMFYKKFKEAGGQIFVTGLKGPVRDVFESLFLLNIFPEIDLENPSGKSE